ncbi:hypothetical protein BV22DRAFT_601430 [Leucogyrophana mollusca]|uniref:Uncharacterized protein n=1 Tax=Leucogyrophana mollusca TaxID=85980 RepID=A0ACB8BDF4_9AGAM|nr:hypothetical protein BV22DRAFT_601430 [Leucogyrophana mollusca]
MDRDPDQPLPAIPSSPTQAEGSQAVQQPEISQQQRPGSGSSQPERIHIITPDTDRPLTTSTAERPLLEGSDGYSPARNTSGPYNDHRMSQMAVPPPARGRDGYPRPPSRRATVISQPPIDYIVPAVEEKPLRIPERTIAMMTGYALNVAIGLQVLLGALTTGLSAATTGRQTSIMTAILGGMATLVASYLARARGSNEPELSITRVKDLDQFLRDCRAFEMDHGPQYGSKDPALKLNERLEELRGRFEELLGNANGERKLSPV